MSQTPVSCIPAAGKMAKAKKVLDEAREIQNPELDLADKGISSFDEMPGLCEYPITKPYLSFVSFLLPNLVCCRDWFEDPH